MTAGDTAKQQYRGRQGEIAQNQHKMKGGSSAAAAIKNKKNIVSNVPASSGSSVVAAFKKKKKNVSKIGAGRGSSAVAAIKSSGAKKSAIQKNGTGRGSSAVAAIKSNGAKKSAIQKNNDSDMTRITSRKRNRNPRRLSYENRALSNALTNAMAVAAMIGKNGKKNTEDSKEHSPEGKKNTEHSKEHWKPPEISSRSKRRLSSHRIVVPTGRRLNRRQSSIMPSSRKNGVLSRSRRMSKRANSSRMIAMVSARGMKDGNGGVVFGNDQMVSLDMSSGGIRMRPTRRRLTRTQRASSGSMNKHQFRNLKSLVTFVQKHNSQRVKLLQTVMTPIKVCSH